MYWDFRRLHYFSVVAIIVIGMIIIIVVIIIGFIYKLILVLHIILHRSLKINFIDIFMQTWGKSRKSLVSRKDLVAQWVRSLGCCFVPAKFYLNQIVHIFYGKFSFHFCKNLAKSTLRSIKSMKKIQTKNLKFLKKYQLKI